MNPLRFEFLEQFLQPFRFRDEIGLSHHPFERDCLPVFSPKLEEVLGINNADDVVDFALENGDSRVAFGDDEVNDVLDSGLIGDTFDIRSWNHNFPDNGLLELEYPVNHLVLFLVDYPLLFADIDDGLDIFFGEGSFSVSEETAAQSHKFVQHAAFRIILQGSPRSFSWFG
jgi:hypothetical protein